ncbi:mechanosensitive ion channel family protein [Thalassococcus sp. S3]|uniref:mechanosensitive ion channel family protein n=1 Tax=Thalassococcus sp. S3 TaxID=2017482 RepID=UPI0010242419|nr:mechanosensitive ion channel family protein [Thalassococcus sp. S3]QBF30674.1 mechanosensitive ion channel protein MscS [Thalassococcus sp. S3]
MRLFLAALFTLIVGLSGGLPAQAQSLLGLGTSSGETAETPPENDLAETLREAAEAGLSVIVVDGNGTLLSAPPPEVEPEEAPGMGMEGASELMKVQARTQAFRETLEERLAAFPDSVDEVAYILRATSPDGRIMTYVEALFWSVILFAVGRVVTVEIYGKRFARRFVVARILENPQGYREKMPFLVFRFIMGIGGTLVTMLVAYVLGSLIFGPVEDLSLQFTITAIYVTFFLARTVGDLWRMVLSPFLSQYRIPKFSDRDAKRLYHFLFWTAALDISVIMFSTWLADFGLNYNVYAIVYGALSLVVLFAEILMVLFNKAAISNAIRNGRPADEVPWLTRYLSYLWAPVVIGYFIFGWFELAFDLVLEQDTSIPLIAGAYGVLLSIIVVYGVINYLIESYFERSRRLQALNEAGGDADTDEAAEEQILPQEQHRMTTYQQLAHRVSGILAFVAGSYALIRIWDSDNDILMDSAVDRALDVVFIMFIGYIVYHVFRIWIDSKIAEETSDMPEAELGDEGGGASSASRLATLLPLFRNFILAVVVVSIILVALLELGINVSPLFAGAGVVGLAVGFGAQTLVRDIFSGAFFLLDDAFRKGEYIDIGDVKGTVEKISVRSFQLRHHLGALHTIPFGEIQVLTNYSRDWVMMKLPLRVTYDTDVEKVRKLIKKLGQDLLSDPVIGDTFIQPLKSQGVIEMQDSAMIIRVKFMTKPGDQWLVRKKVFQEIRDLFEKEGIKFAHREVTVRLADEPNGPMTPKQKEAVTGAVQAAMDEDLLDVHEGSGDDR